MKGAIKIVLGILLVAICSVLIGVLRYQNQELTETMMFLQFWLEWLVLAVGVLIGYMLTVSGFKHE